MKDLIFTTLSKDELISELTAGITRSICTHLSMSRVEEETWTAKQTADFLNVSKVTIHDWTNKGILTKYKIGSRTLYKRSEVLSAIVKVES